MHRTLIILPLAAAAFLVGFSVSAAGREIDQTDELPVGKVMQPGAATRAPFGYVRFCRKHPEQCARVDADKGRKEPPRTASVVATDVAKEAPAGPRIQASSDPIATPMALNANAWRDLRTVNAHYNRKIHAASDRRLYGIADVWTLDPASGDCEDYALTKRKSLIEKGWPSHAVLVTSVRDGAGRPHAVLVVRTDRGDFVLDNLRDDIEIWSRLPYRWIKQQSAADPRKWVRLSGYRQEMVERKRERLRRLASKGSVGVPAGPR